MEAYQLVDNTPVLTVNQWCEAGLSYNQFRVDSRSGYLSILKRSINGQTLIDARSIKRPERRAKVESLLGKIAEAPKKSCYRVEIDTEARAFYVRHRTAGGEPLPPEIITQYTHRASVFNALREGLKKQLTAYAASPYKFKKTDQRRIMLERHTEFAIEYKIPVYSSERSLEKAFKRYLNEGYGAIIHKNFCNDSARVVSASAEKLILAIYRMHNKPFISRVHELYLEFISGNRELFDRETGEVFHPEDYRHKGRALEVSEATIWNYLRDVVNNTSIFADRNGNFDFQNTKMPKQHRKLGKYSLSKVTMDDVAMSRKGITGDVYKYIAVDVVSGYWFRPVYIVGKPTKETVIETFRNMFCELIELGLPMPGELDAEHHLMEDIEWLNEVFQFVYFNNSATSKRAEHAIRSFKYGVAKDNGHTNGRWYAKHEAFRSIRKKVAGDFIENGYEPRVIIEDDLADIKQYNNELHPLQKTYPGMTRKQVLLKHVNPNLKPVEKWYLYRYIGNQTETSIRNNDYCVVNYEEFELTDFGSLKRLKPNSLEVIAYWLPLESGSIDRVYLYQGDVYIGEAVNRAQFAYNECAIERTEEDEQAMLHQDKRVAKYTKFIKDNRVEIPKVEHQKAETSKTILSTPVEIVETVQPEEPDDEFAYEFEDFFQKGYNNM